MFVKIPRYERIYSIRTRVKK